ncbi:unnamed protein product [Protopolystoma xenopodis]|uniref:Uncharacterized protein n=1 Tax=Protopolystoma xenopodis TaxID=117903 RepID=A0A448WRZ9_9PLAT|nr:unnamed protein product [Protopolystoma xenopodis]
MLGWIPSRDCRSQPPDTKKTDRYINNVRQAPSYLDFRSDLETLAGSSGITYMQAWPPTSVFESLSPSLTWRLSSATKAAWESGNDDDDITDGCDVDDDGSTDFGDGADACLRELFSAFNVCLEEEDVLHADDCLTDDERNADEEYINHDSESPSSLQSGSLSEEGKLKFTS